MLASSFEGLYSSLWICICGFFTCGLSAGWLAKVHCRKASLSLALFGLCGAGFLLVDAIRYNQQGKDYLSALAITVACNLMVIILGGNARGKRQKR
jgi:hypothetical protein